MGTRAARAHKPHQYADGISMVMVNGVTVFENGAMNGARPGVVLYGPAFRSDQRSDV